MPTNVPSAEIQKYDEWRGVKGLVAAKLITDTESELTYGQVFAIAGTATVTKETESSNEVHFYDNIPAITINSEGADTITIDVSAIPLDVLGYLTGQTYLSDKGALIEGERENSYFAIGYITENTSNEEVYVWRYKCSIAVPGQTNSTKNNGTDANGQQLVCTGISTIHPFTANGSKPARGLVVNTALNSSVKNTFFSTVTTPDDLGATPAGTFSVVYEGTTVQTESYTASNNATTVTEGTSYTNTLTAAVTGASFKQFACKMGATSESAVDITTSGKGTVTSEAVDGVNNAKKTVNITQVDGNIYFSGYANT